MHNVVRAQRGPTGKETLHQPVDALNQFLDDTFYKTVLQHTNKQLKILRQNYNVPGHHLLDFELEDIRAAVGLLILTGVMCSPRESLNQQWSEDHGRPVFRATMPLERFRVFLVAARFDDKSTRPERRKNDKLAAILATCSMSSWRSASGCIVHLPTCVLMNRCCHSVDTAHSVFTCRQSRRVMV